MPVINMTFGVHVSSTSSWWSANIFDRKKNKNFTHNDVYEYDDDDEMWTKTITREKKVKNIYTFFVSIFLFVWKTVKSTQNTRVDDNKLTHKQTALQRGFLKDTKFATAWLVGSSFFFCFKKLKKI